MRAIEIIVTVPGAAGDAVMDQVFDAVADAAHDAEPETRDGWDLGVHSRPVTHDDASRNHDRIVVLRGEGGWRWVWRSSNGRVLCHSEPYTKRVWCVRMAERVAGERVRVVVEKP